MLQDYQNILTIECVVVYINKIIILQFYNCIILTDNDKFGTYMGRYTHENVLRTDSCEQICNDHEIFQRKFAANRVCYISYAYQELEKLPKK